MKINMAEILSTLNAKWAATSSRRQLLKVPATGTNNKTADYYQGNVRRESSSKRIHMDLDLKGV